MGIKQAIKQMKEQGYVDERPVLQPLVPEPIIWNGKREKWFQMIHPSITYRMIKLLRKNLKLGDEPLIEGTILWDPCEDEERTNCEINGVIRYRIGYMLAAAIMGDQEKLIQGAEKGYSITGNAEAPRTHLKRIANELWVDLEDDFVVYYNEDFGNPEEPVFVKCKMEHREQLPYNMVEIREYSLWGMLFWPVLEKESGLHRTIWEILKTEYQNADDNRRWKLKRMVLNSVDSLYIQKYQEKAMNICRKVFPEMCRVNDRDWKPQKWYKRVEELPMQWKMNMTDSWTQMTIVTENKAVISTDGNAPYRMHDFIQEWVSGISEFEEAREQLTDADISYSEKKWKIDGITVKAWKNKVWPEDKISRQLEKMEKLEYESERNGEKMRKRLLLSMDLLEKQMRENGWEWEECLWLLSCYEYEAASAKQQILPDEAGEFWINEINRRICRMNRIRRKLWRNSRGQVK